MLFGRYTSALSLLAAFTLVGCGAPEQHTADTKIIGGTTVDSDQDDARRLSTVALTSDVTSDPNRPSPLASGKSFCTGTVIAPRVVLTAAHCLQEFDPQTRETGNLFYPRYRDYLVHFGTEVSAAAGQQIPAQKVIPHPNWSPKDTLSPQPSRSPDDIGIVILSRPIPNGYRVAPIAPLNIGLEEGDPVHLAGYGVTRTRENNDTGVLRQVTTEFQSRNARLKLVTVGAPERGACGGDSGGPMYIKRDGRLQVVGATSTGAEDDGRCLGVRNNYTDARRYTDWIDDVIAAEL